MRHRRIYMAVQGTTTFNPGWIVEYVEEKFAKENSFFLGRDPWKMELTLPLFSECVYRMADRSIARCRIRCDHPPSETLAGIGYFHTHVAILVLNTFLRNSIYPVERHPGTVLATVLSLRPKNKCEFDEGYRAEMRKRALNIAVNFYPKQLNALLEYLQEVVMLNNQRSMRSFLLENTSCGSFVDTIACQMIRTCKALAHS
jgi:hypothetical protein